MIPGDTPKSSVPAILAAVAAAKSDPIKQAVVTKYSRPAGTPQAEESTTPYTYEDLRRELAFEGFGVFGGVVRPIRRSPIQRRAPVVTPMPTRPVMTRTERNARIDAANRSYWANMLANTRTDLYHIHMAQSGIGGGARFSPGIRAGAYFSGMGALDVETDVGFGGMWDTAKAIATASSQITSGYVRRAVQMATPIAQAAIRPSTYKAIKTGFFTPPVITSLDTPQKRIQSTSRLADVYAARAKVYGGLAYTSDVIARASRAATLTAAGIQTGRAIARGTQGALPGMGGVDARQMSAAYRQKAAQSAAGEQSTLARQTAYATTGANISRVSLAASLAAQFLVGGGQMIGKGVQKIAQKVISKAPGGMSSVTSGYVTTGQQLAYGARNIIKESPVYAIQRARQRSADIKLIAKLQAKPADAGIIQKSVVPEAVIRQQTLRLRMVGGKLEPLPSPAGVIPKLQAVRAPDRSVLQQTAGPRGTMMLQLPKYPRSGPSGTVVQPSLRGEKVVPPKTAVFKVEEPRKIRPDWRAVLWGPQAKPLPESGAALGALAF